MRIDDALDLSEKFMEDCVVECPTAFLDKPLSVTARQPKINGFRPDLLMEDEAGGKFIVEIQMNAIDRYHLYKCLEYRDSISDERSKANVILVCERIDNRFGPIAKTHGIEVQCIDRQSFIKRAIKYCPNALQEHLIRSDISDNSESRAETRAEKLRFTELNWARVYGPYDVLKFLDREYGRLGINSWDVYRQYYSSVDSAIREFLYRSCRDVCDDVMHVWNRNKEIAKERSINALPLGADLKSNNAKPPIRLGLHITQASNLSVWWGVDYSKKSPWVIEPGHSQYGSYRPEDELLFVRDFAYLRISPAELSSFDDRVNWNVLSAVYVALVKSTYDYLHQLLCRDFAVTKVKDIEFELEKRENTAPVDAMELIRSWSIYDVGKRRKEHEQKWLAKFFIDLGMTEDSFVETYKSMLAKRKGQRRLRFSALSRSLKTIGHRVTPSQAKDLLERIEQFHPHLHWRLEN